MVLLMVADIQGAPILAGNICQILVLVNSVFGSEKLTTPTGSVTFDLIEDAIRYIPNTINRSHLLLTHGNLIIQEAQGTSTKGGVIYL